MSQGKTAEEISRVMEISKQTYYRWRKEYGGLKMTQGKKLKELEKENTRLKTLVADLSLDNAIIKEVLSKNVIVDASIGPGQETASGQASDRCDGCIRTARLPGAATTSLHTAVSESYS